MENTHPIRLSYSSLGIFNDCERKYQLEKRLATDSARDESADLSLGSGYGVGLAHYMLTQDKVASIYKAWLAYWPEIETDKKSVWRMIQALEASFHVADALLTDYEVLQLDSGPAIELSFKIMLDEVYYYVGHIDFVMRNRWDGTCVVWDAKSTGLPLLDVSANYENSEQGLGYSIALDAIVGEAQSTYAVGYFVAQLLKDANIRIHPLIFKKSLLDRLHWLMSLGGDLDRLHQADKLGFFPRRGKSCLKFNRPCKHYGVCNLTSMDVPRTPEEDTIKYDYVFQLDDLIEDHIRRV